MNNKVVAPIQLKIDASEAISQVGNLTKLFELPSSSFEGIPEHIVNLFFSRVRGLIDDIVSGDFSTTISTGDINEICIKVKIVGPLERLATAIRANDFHGLHEYILSTVGEIRD
ncbi:hypothetical protein [Cedecea sp. FDAARGOS_727]|uniref:hypothetical protein n=1 Tax=Cedecea sp. FDAARGOS_727 TaxID=2545798 RepID=UPI00143E38E5|nr:hypothetical protein [Cedecea sp. FDAARGOS_727]QIX97444.1 hypothetical protein FOC35_17905 [Cedecea sp. FDAARGOS_727]